MKKNKILSLILMITLFLSMSMVAFAVEPGPTDNAGNPIGDQTDGDWTEVKFKKSITTIDNTGALHPEETFGFTITPVSAKDEQGNAIAMATIPAFNPSTFNITVDEGIGEETVEVDLPTFSNIGTYVYKVQETASNTAGMEYDTTEYEFTVIVLNDGVNNDGVRQLKRLILKDEDGIKTDVFMNEYKAGSLVVNKEITGNNANFEETFPVKVTLTAPEGKKINSTITVAGNEGTVVQTGNGNNEVVITFDVTNNSNVTLANIPYNVTYVVEETNLKNYTATYDDNTEGSIGAASIETKIINDLSREIATGINLDNLPYMILVAATAAGFVTIIVKRRRRMEF